MDNKIVDFSAFAAKKPKGENTDASTGALMPKVAGEVTVLVPHSRHLPRLLVERLDPRLDRGSQEFFDLLREATWVVILTPGIGIDYDSLIMIEDLDGRRPVLSMMDFVRLTTKNHAAITTELLDGYLLDTFSNWGIKIVPRRMDGDSDVAYLERRLDEFTLSKFKPETLPVEIRPNELDEWTYSCFFSDADIFVSEVLAVHFEDPTGMTVLDMMCLAYTDFLDEGNTLESARASLNVELEQENVGRDITIIPVPLLEKIIGDSIMRRDPRFANFSPTERIWKYVQKFVLPRVNAAVYTWQ